MWNSQLGACECPPGTVENKETGECERPTLDQAGPESQDLFADDDYGSDFGSMGGGGLFGMFSGSESIRVSWTAIVRICLTAFLVWCFI